MEITEAIAIELTKNCLKGDELPIGWRYKRKSGYVVVYVSDNKSYIFNRVEVEHARIMTGEKNEG